MDSEVGREKMSTKGRVREDALVWASNERKIGAVSGDRMNDVTTFYGRQQEANIGLRFCLLILLYLGR